MRYLITFAPQAGNIGKSVTVDARTVQLAVLKAQQETGWYIVDTITPVLYPLATVNPVTEPATVIAA